MNVNINTVTATNTVTLTNKTLDKSVILGVPVAEGALGRDTTQKALSSFNNGVLGTHSRVLVSGIGTTTLINDMATDQDFATIYPFPANTIFTNKRYRLSLTVEMTTGVAAITCVQYLKLGATKIATSLAVDVANSLTAKSMITRFEISGRTAAGAAADVDCAFDTYLFANSNPTNNNLVNQPVTGLATNGALNLIFGITFSGIGSTESLTLLSWLLEELN